MNENKNNHQKTSPSIKNLLQNFIFIWNKCEAKSK